MKQKVALVLASGGARGLAHIGAIEELESRGYQITSIAGCSIGSLIAGIYASGKLQEGKQWFLSLDKQKILSLGDFAISKNYLVKGDRTVNAFREIVPNCNIEELPIPVSLIASDIIHNKEVVIEQGDLFEAVRASVSIPLFFRPVQKDDMLLVDGGILNACPLNRVRRTEGDLLVAMNISAPDSLNIEKPKSIKISDKIMSHLPDFVADMVEDFLREREEDYLSDSITYTSLLSRMTDMMIQNNTVLMNRLVHCDILAQMPMNKYPTFAFDEAEQIIEDGRQLMRKAIDEYEANTKTKTTAGYKPALP